MLFKNIIIFTTFALFSFVNPSFSQSGNSVIDRSNQLRQTEVQRNINLSNQNYSYYQSAQESEQRSSFFFWTSAVVATLTIAILGYKKIKKDGES